MRLVFPFSALVAFPALAVAQNATLSGLVLTAVDGKPIAEVEVAITVQSKNAFTNERGEFRIENIAPGRTVVTVRRVGYAVQTDTIDLVANQVLERSYRLARVTTLDTIAVVEPRLQEFEENRKIGLGKFLTRADVDRMAGQPIANQLATLATIGVARGRGGKGFLLTSRARLGDPVWCPQTQADSLNNLRCACYAQVYLDNALMNPLELVRTPGTRQMYRATPPFDVNSISSAMIEAVEWYAGPAQTPMKYSRRESNCGVLIIHSRRTK